MEIRKCYSRIMDTMYRFAPVAVAKDTNLFFLLRFVSLAFVINESAFLVQATRLIPSLKIPW